MEQGRKREGKLVARVDIPADVHDPAYARHVEALTMVKPNQPCTPAGVGPRFATAGTRVVAFKAREDARAFVEGVTKRRLKVDENFEWLEADPDEPKEALVWAENLTEAEAQLYREERKLDKKAKSQARKEAYYGWGETRGLRRQLCRRECLKKLYDAFKVPEENRWRNQGASDGEDSSHNVPWAERINAIQSELFRLGSENVNGDGPGQNKAESTSSQAIEAQLGRRLGATPKWQQDRQLSGQDGNNNNTRSRRGGRKTTKKGARQKNSSMRAGSLRSPRIRAPAHLGEEDDELEFEPWRPPRAEDEGALVGPHAGSTSSRSGGATSYTSSGSGVAAKSSRSTTKHTQHSARGRSSGGGGDFSSVRRRNPLSPQNRNLEERNRRHSSGLINPTMTHNAQTLGGLVDHQYCFSSPSGDNTSSGCELLSGSGSGHSLGEEEDFYFPEGPRRTRSDGCLMGEKYSPPPRHHWDADTTYDGLDLWKLVEAALGEDLRHPSPPILARTPPPRFSGAGYSHGLYDLDDSLIRGLAAAQQMSDDEESALVGYPRPLSHHPAALPRLDDPTLATTRPSRCSVDAARQKMAAAAAAVAAQGSYAEPHKHTKTRTQKREAPLRGHMLRRCVSAPTPSSLSGAAVRRLDKKVVAGQKNGPRNPVAAASASAASPKSPKSSWAGLFRRGPQETNLGSKVAGPTGQRRMEHQVAGVGARPPTSTPAPTAGARRPHHRLRHAVAGPPAAAAGYQKVPPHASPVEATVPAGSVAPSIARQKGGASQASSGGTPYEPTVNTTTDSPGRSNYGAPPDGLLISARRLLRAPVE